MDKDKINELLKSKNDKKKIDDFVNKNLSSGQKNQLQDILSDKQKLQSVLNSPQAKELFNKFMKD